MPNRWDLVAIPLVLGLLFVISWGTRQVTVPYYAGEVLPLSLNPAYLPEYALRTTLRMVAAMLFSLLFTFTYATYAAKSRRAEALLIPVLDVLQSVPILGFLSITVTGFIDLFHGSMLGPEAAAVFAIFTSQAWNMAFSFYHSLKMIPKDLYQAAHVFQLSPWQRFWKLEVPFALPALVWNSMMSASGGWFFVVASEAISVAGHHILLPGIGSYIAVAIRQQDLTAIGYAIGTMFVVITLYDQLVFRPLVAWSERFRVETVATDAAPGSWVLTLLRRARLIHWLMQVPEALWEASQRFVGSRRPTLPLGLIGHLFHREERLLARLWRYLTIVSVTAATVLFARYVLAEVGYLEIAYVLLLGLITATRVVVLVALAALIWVPVGVWVGQRPRVAQAVQPLAQFLAAFPANLLFPLAVVGIVRYHLNVEIWLSPLMILGTQWYILFNVIAGASVLPGDLREVALNLGLSRWQRWRRLILPGIFPACVTGGLTAFGGAWNASVVAEVVNWGHTQLTATGLGAYIAQQTVAGDYPRIALGIVVMSLYVLVFNRLFWQRLYHYAEERFNLLG
ncbi:MAG: sulfonate ABC transporter permease [Chromatiales bacterium 21-64-14]|nr:MAG: sulfonate ABC transporter permease [Chromatiales bacterium 21-64-14]HQU17285.1 ABC transporter permease subunit [Gammaproteobacteria bacterium]